MIFEAPQTLHHDFGGASKIFYRQVYGLEGRCTLHRCLMCICYQKSGDSRALLPSSSLCVCQREKEYLEGCTFLPHVNNEQLRKEPSVKQRFAKLNRLALVMVRSHTAALCSLDRMRIMVQAGNDAGSTVCGPIQVAMQLSPRHCIRGAAWCTCIVWYILSCLLAAACSMKQYPLLSCRLQQ